MRFKLGFSTRLPPRDCFQVGEYDWVGRRSQCQPSPAQHGVFNLVFGSWLVRGVCKPKPEPPFRFDEVNHLIILYFDILDCSREIIHIITILFAGSNVNVNYTIVFHVRFHNNSNSEHRWSNIVNYCSHLGINLMYDADVSIWCRNGLTSHR